MITIRQQLLQYNNTGRIRSRYISSSAVLLLLQQQQQHRQKCKLLQPLCNYNNHKKIRSSLSQNQQQYRRSIIYHNYSSTNIRTTTNNTNTNINSQNQNGQKPLRSINEYYQSLIQWYTIKLETHPYIIKGITSGIIAALGDITCQYITTKTNTIYDTNDTNHDSDNDTIDTSSTTITPSTSLSIQDQQNEQQKWDYLRTIRFFILGSLYVAPLCHLWYNALAKWYPIQRNISKASTITSNINTIRPLIQRVWYDQFIFTPIFLIGWLSSLKTMEEYMQYMNTNINHQNDIQPMNNDATTMIGDVSTIISETKSDNDNCNDNNNQTTINQYSTIIQSNILFILKTYYTNAYNIIYNISDQLIVPILYSNWILWIPVQLYNFYYISTKYQVLFSNCIALIWNIYLSYITSLSSSSKKDNNEKE